MNLTKFANWFSDQDSNQDSAKDSLNNKPIEQPLQLEDPKWEQTQLTIEKLQQELQGSQKQVAQTKAQLQIYQGFKIELGETQLKLQKTEAELQRFKKDLFEQQKQLNNLQAEYQSTKKSLTQIAEQKNWLTLLKTPVQIIEVKKTLPKHDFETLWGFGILSPTVETIITTGAITVRGWVLGKKALAQTVKVLYQGETLLESLVNLRRPVIAQQYPDILPAGQSGFEFSLGVAGIVDEIELNLEAALEDQTIISLCNFLLKPQQIESNDT